MLNKHIDIIKVDQPIGRFYIGVLKAKEIINISESKRKSEHKDGIQRDLSKKRINDIKTYCLDPDATFPTSVVVALKDDESICKIESNKLLYNSSCIIGEIIDGQHRIWGLKKAFEEGVEIDAFELPIVFMEGLNDEEKAFVFSIINSTQTKVNKSLIYDLFDVFNSKSPYKTCHIIARSMNGDEKSPFYKRMKMLGYGGNKYETISQGSFINYLMPLVSKNIQEDINRIKRKEKLLEDKNLPLRSYFIDGKDEIILKIMMNLFIGLKNVFPEEWENSDRYILSKAIGYGGVMKAFPNLYKLGVDKKTLTPEFFESCFEKLKWNLCKKRIELTSDNFSGAKGQNKLKDLIIESINEI